MTVTDPAVNPPTAPEVRAVIARHLAAIGDRYMPLGEFLLRVEAELDDYWPASGTLDDSAWTEAEMRWAAGDR